MAAEVHEGKAVDRRENSDKQLCFHEGNTCSWSKFFWAQGVLHVSEERWQQGRSFLIKAWRPPQCKSIFKFPILLLAQAQAWISEQVWPSQTGDPGGLAAICTPWPYWLAHGELNVQIILRRKLGKHGCFKMSHFWCSWDIHQRWSSCFMVIWVKNWFVFLNKIKIEFCCILHCSLSFVPNLIIWNYIKYINSLLNTEKKPYGKAS